MPRQLVAFFPDTVYKVTVSKHYYWNIIHYY